jgi:peroxin-19
MDSGEDLDDILNSALEDMEALENPGPSHPSVPISQPILPSSISSPSSSSSASSSSSSSFSSLLTRTAAEEKLESPLPELPEEFVEGMKKLMEELRLNEDLLREGAEPSDTSSPFKSEESDTEFDKHITKTLDEMFKNTKELEKEGEESDFNPNMIKEMMEQLEGSPEFQGVMEKMMDEILSKDVLHEPLQQMRELYPTWLAANRSKISEEDYRRYSKQYEYVQRICEVYERQPENTTQIMQLMQEMQAEGQPPTEIVQNLAPGLNFGSDGMPEIPELDQLLHSNNPDKPCLLM